MSDDIELDTSIKNEIVPEKVQQEEPKPLSRIEEMASKHGWNPSGEKGAEEFVEYAMTNLASRGKDVKAQTKAIEALLDLNEKQNEAGRKEGYEKAMSELKAAKIEAIEQGDVEQVESIEEEISTKQEEYTPVNKDQLPSAVQEFNEQHKEWLKEDTSRQSFKMRDFAKRYDNFLAESELPVEEHMAKLDKSVREEFPDYFNDTQQVSEDVKMYPTVDSGANSGVAGKTESKLKWSDLPNEYKDAARALERMGTMTKEKYIKQLIETGVQF